MVFFLVFERLFQLKFAQVATYDPIQSSFRQGLAESSHKEVKAEVNGV